VSDDRYGDRTVLVADDVTATLEADSFENDAFEGTVARIPLAYGDTVYGTLSVATERPAAFGDDERAWLATIGRQVGYAIAAIRRRNLLLSDRVTELEVVCRDDRSFFVDVSRRLDCRFELDSLVPIDESTQLYYVRLEDASPADVFDLADDEPGIEDCRLVETDEEGWRIEVVVDGSCPIVTLTEYGVTVHEAVFEGGTATITGDCAVDADLRTIVDGLRSAFPDSELVGKRETERAVQTAREFREGARGSTDGPTGSRAPGGVFRRLLRLAPGEHGRGSRGRDGRLLADAAQPLAEGPTRVASDVLRRPGRVVTASRGIVT